MRAQLGALSQTVTDLGAKFIRLGAAMALPLGLATKRFVEFDDQMRAVGAVLGGTQAEFDLLTDKAKQLGATTSFSAAEVAGLMLELARAGFSAKQIDNATESVLNLSRATGTEAAMAAGIMSAGIRQFGLAAEDATRVADAFTVAANRSFNTVELLGQAMEFAGPVAADFELSIEDALAALGALGNVGIQGAKAGTALRRILILLGSEGEKFEEIFGVVATDAEGNVRNIVDVLDEMQQSLQGLGTAEQSKKLNAFFGLLGITGASALSKNAAGVRELREDIENLDGAAARTAEQMDAGLGGAFRRLSSAVDGVAIALGEALAPLLDKISAGIGRVAGAIQKWIEQNPELAQTVGVATLSILGAGAALLALGLAIKAAQIAFTVFTTAIAAVSLAVKVVTTVITIATSALTAMATATTVVGAVLAGLQFFLMGVVGAIGVFLFKAARAVISSDQFGESLSRLKNTFTASWKGIKDAIAAGDLRLAMQIAGAALRIVWLELTHQLEKIWFKFLKNVINAFAAFLKFAARFAVLTENVPGLDLGRNLIDLAKVNLIGKVIDKEIAAQKAFNKERPKLQDKLEALVEEAAVARAAAEAEREKQLQGKNAAELAGDFLSDLGQRLLFQAALAKDKIPGIAEQVSKATQEAAGGFSKRIGAFEFGSVADKQLALDEERNKSLKDIDDKLDNVQLQFE